MSPDSQKAQNDRDDAEVDVLLFEVGGTLFGADASQVLRIERLDGSNTEAAVGEGGSRERALRQS